MYENTNLRPFRGTKLENLPNEFVVFDLETSDFNIKVAEIIEIAAIKVKNNEIVDTFSSLVKPKNEISEQIVNLTKITNEMLLDKPTIDVILPTFLKFVRNNVVTGYNIASFDYNIIYDYSLKLFNIPFCNDYFDILPYVRRKLPNMYKHNLIKVSEFLGIENTKYHRALDDCITTLKVYQKIKRYLNDEIVLSYQHIDNTHSILENLKDTSFISGKIFCITGNYDYFPRNKLINILESLGGINSNSVTLKLDILFIPDSKNYNSSKLKKAKEYIDKGKNIKIIQESKLYSLLNI